MTGAWHSTVKRRGFGVANSIYWLKPVWQYHYLKYQISPSISVFPLYETMDTTLIYCEQYTLFCSTDKEGTSEGKKRGALQTNHLDAWEDEQVLTPAVHGGVNHIHSLRLWQTGREGVEETHEARPGGQ